MKRVSLDTAPSAVKEFVRDSPVELEGVELELNGRVICKVMPSTYFSDVEKKALVEDRWELIRRAQQRNKGVPGEVVEREIEDAIEQVRGQKRK